MFRRISLCFALFSILAAFPAAQQGTPLADLKTTPEATGYKNTSTYDEVVKFMRAVDAASPNVFYVAYGKTYEGREMPMAVVGAGLKDGSAASVRATGRLRVHIQGNIHAGEVEGKEAAQVLLRELAQGKHADWLRSMVFLITPIFNADGNEKFALTNRQRQNGPINGMGTRQQGQNLNINRDFMKLDTPEGRAFVKLWNDYDPQVGYDLHTSDGSAHGYYLTYAPGLSPITSPSVMGLMRDELFPFVTKEIKAKHGWDTFYYGNVGGGGPGIGRGAAPAPGAAGAAGAAGAGAAGAGAAGAGAGGGRAGGGGAPGGGRGGTPRPCTPPDTLTPGGAHSAVAGAPETPNPLRTWNSFEALPRYHNTYVGMRNRFALLSEAYAYATFEDRIKVTNYFMEESLNFAMRNADKLKKIAADADKESIVGKELATRQGIKVEGTTTILMGEVEDEVNPVNGSCMNRRKDVLKAEVMNNGLWFAATATEVAPATYYVPAAAAKAIELLRAHGVQLTEVKQPVGGVEQFAIASNTARQPNGGIDTGAHGLRTLTGSWESAAGVTVPAGSFAVSLNQPLGRLAFYLLAPTSDDGLTTWNFLDDLLGDGVKTYPILRKK
ncbi:MAG TPA: M14 family zinc carboxypeptidase [Vicinamibacterales bacterium]|nr:M14 family zinc carboxypeptidase [Vicinamibacterales bacterium]